MEEMSYLLVRPTDDGKGGIAFMWAIVNNGMAVFIEYNISSKCL
jgi:hypothetical protein